VCVDDIAAVELPLSPLAPLARACSWSFVTHHLPPVLTCRLMCHSPVDPGQVIFFCFRCRSHGLALHPPTWFLVTRDQLDCISSPSSNCSLACDGELELILFFSSPSLSSSSSCAVRGSELVAVESLRCT
jgi:hypothetical protein